MGTQRTASSPIRFGTSGWRGVLGEDFTFPWLRAAARGVARWLAEEGDAGEVIVAHDTRFLGDRAAATVAAILQSGGASVRLACGPTATPVVTRALVRRRAAAAIVITASHNPPEYQGMKVFGRSGGGIERSASRRIEALAAEASRDEPVDAAEAVPTLNLAAPYVRELLGRIDSTALDGAGLTVVYDAMHGAGAGVLDAVLARAGVRVRVRRAAADPTFGGCPPDPTPNRLRGLAAEVAGERGLRLGLATDGDADRFAVIDCDGRALSETESLALLVDHLARSGRIARGVAISLATGSLVERVAAHHGLRVERTPIGFKHLTRAMASGEIDAAGEESGGFALASFGRDKDGILAGALMAELVAVTRRPLRARLDELERQHGRSACGRVALPAVASARAALVDLCSAPPERVDRAAVRAVSREDGLHLALDDGFLMLRASDTEPVLRIYAEARGPRLLRRRLLAGARLLGAELP